MFALVLVSNKLMFLQVTLTAEEDSCYISWRRRRLYMMISKDRYIARVFSVMLGHDIAEKLYNLNNKLYIKSGVLLDIRLPSLYHVLAPSSQGSEGGSGSDCYIIREPQIQQSEGKEPAYPKADLEQLQPLPPHLQGPRRTHLDEPWGLQPDPELPSGEDSTSLVLEDFADVVGSLTDYGSERDYLR